MGRALGILATVAVVVGVASSHLQAHHSFAAEFDANQPVTLKGTVTKMEWINPHSWIHLEVKNPDGTVTQWMIEGGTPNTPFGEVQRRCSRAPRSPSKGSRRRTARTAPTAPTSSCPTAAAVCKSSERRRPHPETGR
jgi:hypothetical protein